MTIFAGDIARIMFNENEIYFHVELVFVASFFCSCYIVSFAYCLLLCYCMSVTFTQ